MLLCGFEVFITIYKDRNNFFARLAVDPETIFDVMQEFLISDEELANFKKERNAINSYLLELGKFRSSTNTKIYQLPKIEPQIPRQRKAIV